LLLWYALGSAASNFGLVVESGSGATMRRYTLTRTRSTASAFMMSSALDCSAGVP
jgi:hypothetical protein